MTFTLLCLRGLHKVNNILFLNIFESDSGQDIRGKKERKGENVLSKVCEKLTLDLLNMLAVN